MNPACYLLAFTIPLSVATSFALGGTGSYLTLFYTFGALPLLELWIPAHAFNLSPEVERARAKNRYFDLLLWCMVPIQYILLYAYCRHIAQGPSSVFEMIGLTSAMGIGCGVLGINVAHELGHRRTRFERIMARALLCTSLNWQFYIEHNRGHHLKVSTPDDSESAHLNESIYAFWFRAVTTSYLAAWNLDPIEMIIGTLLQAALSAFLYFHFGSFALLGFFASAGVGILLLQSVNYIEHYGLCRIKTPEGRFESVKPHHSWNSDQVLSRAVLFELSRHSDHHANASRKYPVLRHFDSSPELPTGYPGMILLALIPRLWFARMNPKITPASTTAS